jgi:hypothetical protein
MNRPSDMPKTLAQAYDKVSSWVVTVTRTKVSYVSEQHHGKGGSEKGKDGVKAGKGTGREKGRPS